MHEWSRKKQLLCSMLQTALASTAARFVTATGHNECRERIDTHKIAYRCMTRWSSLSVRRWELRSMFLLLLVGVQRLLENDSKLRVHQFGRWQRLPNIICNRRKQVEYFRNLNSSQWSIYTSLKIEMALFFNDAYLSYDSACTQIWKIF